MLVALHYRIAAVLLACAGIYAEAQWVSPCPELFQYEPRNPNEPDRWYGTVTLLSEFELFGVWLSLVFDKSPIQLANWFGEVMVKEDKRELLIMNPGHILAVNTPYKIKFYVKYNPKLEPPKLKGFRLNAKTVCPARKATPPPVIINGQKFTSVERTTVPSKPTVVGQTTVSSQTTVPSINQVSGQMAPASGILETPSLVHAPSLLQTPSPSIVGSEQSTALEPATSVGQTVPDSSSTPSVDNRGQSTTLNPVTPSLPVSSPIPDSSSPQFINNREQSTSVDPAASVTSSASVSISSGIEETSDDFFHEGLIQEPSTSKPSPITQDDDLICGTVDINPLPLLTNDRATHQTEFPWHGGLYHAKGYGLEYICGATLITRSHVITVAHCVTLRNTTQTISPDGLVVYLGKFYLKKWSSPEIQEKNVRQISAHPKFDPRYFSNDIAIVRLVSAVEITSFVRPVCLWNEDAQLEKLVRKVGIVTGWGYDENRKLTEELTKSKMRVVSQETCILSSPDFYSKYTSSNTFCAGYRNDTAACNGDSGSGLVFPKAKSSQGGTVWQLRGLISTGLALRDQLKCDSSQYVVFTDVVQHLDWIRTLLN